jgi:hypothetical protein
MVDAKKIEELRGQETEYLRHKADYEHGNVAGPEAWHAAARVFGNAMIPHAGQLLDLAERATLSLAGEDAAGLCERLEKRAAFWERYWTGRSLQDPDSGPIREAAALIRSLSLRVEDTDT